MTDFINTNWAKEEFGKNYLDKADIYIVERRRMFSIIRSFAGHFIQSAGKKKVLDLGCGDGILSEELLRLDPSFSATLVDGSEDMLLKAKARLGRFDKTSFIRASFQDLLAGNVMTPGFDLVFSSMAIHHLTMDEKRALFRKIHRWLDDGGYFVNIDVVLAPTDTLDSWYMKLWADWMDGKKAAMRFEGEDSGDIIRRYKSPGENKPDILEAQMDALRTTGFKEVDCYYKYGIFTIYGGRK